MSQIPFMLEDLQGFHHPDCLLDRNFGLGILHDDLVHTVPRRYLGGPLHARYYHPWCYQPAHRSTALLSKDDKDCFKVNLDVQQFAPEEITVKLVDDFVVIEGKHDERQDEHGFISRQFQRRYKLPSACKLNTVKSSLSSDGVLTVTASMKPLALPAAKERIVPIIQTNAPAMKEGTQNDEKV